MNINLTSDISLNTSQQLEFNQTEPSFADGELFQQLLAQNQKQIVVTENGLTAESDIVDKYDEGDVSDILIAMANPFDTFNLQQTSLTIDCSFNQGEMGEDHISTINTKLTDSLMLDRVVEDSGEQYAAIDIRSAQRLLISINESEQFYSKTSVKDQVTHLSNSNSDEQTIEHANIDKVQSYLSPLQTSINTQNTTPSFNSIVEQMEQLNNIENISPINLEQSPSFFNVVDGQNFLTTLLPSTMSNSEVFAMKLPMPIDVSKWQTSLTEKITMICRQGVQNAEIKLHPETLGSLHIKLAMIDDKLNLQMLAAHNAVKGVLESALPYLKTSLEEQGMTLQHTDIREFSMKNDSEPSSSDSQHKEFMDELLPDDFDESIEQSHQEKISTYSGLSIFA